MTALQFAQRLCRIRRADQPEFVKEEGAVVAADLAGHLDRSIFGSQITQSPNFVRDVAVLGDGKAKRLAQGLKFLPLPLWIGNDLYRNLVRLRRLIALT